MSPQMTALEHAAQLGRTQGFRPTYGYYRQPNGWITGSPATDLEELNYRREGWEPLTQYGRFEMGTPYMADHPLEPLFMRGGAHELPVDQIIEQALHLNPPVIPSCGRALDQDHKGHTARCWQNPVTVTFPQLNGEMPDGFQCRFCDRQPSPTEKARDQHEGVMHREEKSDIRTGETLADSLVRGLRGNAPVAGAVPENPYVCGVCGEGFNAPVKLASHVKVHKEQAHEDEVAEG